MGTNKESKIANILLIGLAVVASFAPCRAQPVDILMKGYQPTKPNAYQCTAYKVPEVIEYINKFEAIGNLTRIHHIIVYGCDGSAASTLPSWSCPAMCRNAIDESILFAWARNGTPTVLPADVGFRIGSNTTVKTLVLQVHYAKPLTEKDYSGVRIYTTQESPKFVAGIFFMVANTFQLPRGFSAYAVDISCNYNFKETLSIFAVRAHTHGLGVVVSGYHRNSTGNHLIQKVNPQWPQTFYPVNGSIQVKPGDAVFARCIYDTTKAKSIVGVGPAGEMCNYYIMYYTDSSVQNTYYRCINSSRKDLTGNNFPPEGNIPLPPNVYLEEIAQGIEHNSSMSVRSVRSARVEPKENVIHDSTIDILMPGAKPSKPDAYLCTAYPVEDEEYYIYKFEALANAATAHHMLLYGCDGEPLSTESIWDCPGMCKNGRSTIMFAWAKNAPPTVLPKGVALRVGKNTSIKTIVLQVHYAKIFKDSEPPDHSGLKIYTTFQKPQFVAGIFLLASNWFEIPPQVSSYPVDISCTFQKEKSIFPFAYRTHAHGLGKVITGYQYNGTYHEIGKGNPQWPQAFYPVKEIIEVKPGDALAARCTYDSTSMDHSVGVGSTGNDEMCNYYIMFYTDSFVADPSGDCKFNELTTLTGDNFPKDVSVPLPPNPALEEAAIGSHNHPGVNPPEQNNENLFKNLFSDSKTQEILMPGAKPKTPDAYLCTAYRVLEEEFYIYKFEALANAATAHHMLLYGCDGEPFSTDSIWNCPLICKNGRSSIMFAWAKNAPPTVMPKGVGLRVGSRTSIQTIVLQVHYAKVFKDSEPEDHSGLKFYTTHQKPQYVAGIFLLAAGFTIPPHVNVYPVDISCTFRMDKSIFPFAYRTHAHGLGRVITGYQHNGSYHEIGKGNPQWPQAFYPVKDVIEVKPGDALAARCTYNSSSMDHAVGVGSTGNDEMCNFYIMFYTDSSVANPSGQCSANELPQLTGDNFPKDVSVPLPPNPALEEAAIGSHHHSGMNHPDEANENLYQDTKTQDILMPGAKPKTPDAYLCTAYPVLVEELYIYKFEALANAATAHHMLLYGCDGEPFSTDSIWNCPPMCKNGQPTIMFAWAKNAPPTVMPKDVGLRVGRKTSIKTIVLQVHYAKIFEDSEPADHSGLKLYTTHQKPQYVAGIFLLDSGDFTIPPHTNLYPVDISCTFMMDKSIFPFAYRTHAHGLGTVITGYQHNGTYHEIGKGNPQWPQAFYPVKEVIEVKPGDALAVRCTYNSSLMDHPVGVGSTGNDEMCNYYIMFYTDSSVADPSGECAFNELTQLTGKNFPIDVSVPLPPNPALEEAAIGSHHHAGMNHPDEANVDFEGTQILKILMRGARPRKPDSYLCTAYPAQDLESYIYKFEAVADANTAHHMLLYGCDGEAYSQEPIWNCPAMCKNSHPVILFAWAKNAPPTVLPKDVGLRFGNRTFIKTLVLQVHYARIFTDAEDEDHSGLKIYVTHKKQPYVAGVFFLGSALFMIPQGHSSFPVDVGCRFSKEKSIFPFAYRPHAHGLGRVITGYQYNGSYHEIGKGNPQWPQTFYPVTNKIEVKNGDYLLGRCTYDSTSMDHPVNVGSTGNDEMCNFYIMFYTDSSVQEPYGECLGDSEPDLTGNNFPADVSVPLPPNPALEEEAKGVHNHHGGMAGGNNGRAKKKSKNIRLLIRTIAAKKKTILNKQPKPLHLVSEIQLARSLKHHHSSKEERMQLDYDVVDPVRHRRQAQEYYDEYAANDLREKGMYGTATSSEEGLSRNRNKGFEAISQQLEHFPRKNAAGRINQSQRLDQNQGKQPLSENTNHASINRQNSEHRQPPNSVGAIEVGQSEAVHKPHSYVHLEKPIFNSSWPEESITFGQIGGVAIDTSGNVYVFHRGSRKWTAQSFNFDNDFRDQSSPITEDVITILTSSGHLIKTFGAGKYFMPHGITVDHQGTIWLTDVAMHQVFKIPQGQTEPKMTLGQKFQHGEDTNLFCKPTDVAVLMSGEFFVSDGYCNSRVLKFSKDGTFLMSFGKRNVQFGAAPPVVTFDIPHSITVSEEHHLVCVADRENGRIQCFDLDGNFKQVIKRPEFGPRLFALEYCPAHGGLLYAVNGPAFDGPIDTTVQGFTIDINTGDLLEMWNVPDNMRNPHDVAADPVTHSIYVGELDPERVWKFSRPITIQPSSSQHIKVEESTQSQLPVSNPLDQSENNTTGLSEAIRDSSDVFPSVIIGILLVVPVILLLIIVLLVRAHQSGKLKCYGHGKKVFNLKGFNWNSHKGFDRLSTEESDHEVDPDDLDDKDYLTPPKKNKA
ncbi:alpha-amidating enzyme precursor 1 [Biomphalaria pfeifferi]|uniref:Alpha-amidating enzyme 1 n=1 Tax=Biomphalaria pfeifferi TaxID=112525 RepID=A0AAD8F880_BIOPF|nr:alpha-amidating enzyme precursor 1 [Biomphalaria pfeifferi]